MNNRHRNNPLSTKNMQLNPKIKAILIKIKPWAIYIALFLVLRYSGILAGVSDVTHRALLQTGAMNANTAPVKENKKFNYNFELLDLNQTKIDVSEFKGKTIFLNLWATWCGPCRAEMPSIQSLYEKVDRDKVAFIMLSIDHNDPFTKVPKYIQSNDFTFPVYYPAGTLPQLLQVRSIPTTFVIAPDGSVIYSEMGTANYDTEEFKNFLEQR